MVIDDMMEDYKYSVLMSTYYKDNRDFLVLSIESMLNQTIPPEEFIIVKDGKVSIEVEELIFHYQELYPNLFTIISLEQNVGLGLALNEGLKISRNELIARMDSDDISLPERCELQLKKFKEDQDLVIVGSYVDEFFDNPQKPISTRAVPQSYQDIKKFAKRRSPFNHPTVMYKKSKVLAIGGYSNLRRNQDVDLFGRMIFNNYKACNINKSLLLFRSDSNLMKRRKSWQNTILYIKVIKKFWKLGFSSFWDLLIVTISQLIVFIMPSWMQAKIYKIFLRKKVK